MVEAFKKQCGIKSLKDTLYTSPEKNEEGDRLPAKYIFDIAAFKQRQKDSSVSEATTDRDIKDLSNNYAIIKILDWNLIENCDCTSFCA